MSLVSQNTLHATQLSVDATRHCFMLAGECVQFDEVNDLSLRFTELYVNSVYMGKLLEIKLHFHQQRPAFTARVDTRHPYDYARLYQLAYHLSEYRQQLEQTNDQAQAPQPAEQVGGYSAKPLFFIGLLVFTAFAVNGWFGLCCLDNPWIEVPSLLAQILWPIFLLVLALHWFWLQPSQRQQKQREAELEIQVIAGQLPQPPNPGWFKKWSWLWIVLAATGITFGMPLGILLLK